jgi:NAD(P)H-dependent FMN reductase
VQKADGLLISSPEYAHGIPGSLKNALDWLVSGSEMQGKPVAIWDASTRSSHAQESLREILKTISVRLADEVFVRVPLLGKQLSVEEIVGDPEMAGPLKEALDAFEGAIRSRN